MMEEEEDEEKVEFKSNEFKLKPYESILIQKLIETKYKLIPEIELKEENKIEESSSKAIKKTESKKKLLKKIKEMTKKEKEELAVLIRALPIEQLKGIAHLFPLEDDKSAEFFKDYVELDLGLLSSNKLKTLEKYVRTCMKSSTIEIPDKYKIEFKKSSLNKSIN